MWMKTEAEGKTVETAQLPSFNHTPHITTANGFDKRIEVTLGWDKQTVISKNNEIVSSTTKFATQTELTKKAIELSKQPGYEYLGELINQGNVNLTAMDLYNQQWDFKQQGLTPAAAALIAMAVTMATGGSGASVGATLASSVGFTSPAVLAAANAAFASFLSQTTVVLINNQGDIGKTLRDIATTDTLRSMATAALTAGITEKLNINDWSNKTFIDKVTKNFATGIVDASVEATINGESFEKTLKNKLRDGLIDAGTATAFKGVKFLDKDGANSLANNIAHKLAAGGLGCLSASAKAGYADKDKGQECSAGALGAIIGEAYADYMVEKGKEGDLNSDQMQHIFNMSKLLAASAAVVAGVDVNTAANSASTAVVNNALSTSDKKRLVDSFKECNYDINCDAVQIYCKNPKTIINISRK